MTFFIYDLIHSLLDILGQFCTTNIKLILIQLERALKILQNNLFRLKSLKFLQDFHFFFGKKKIILCVKTTLVRRWFLFALGSKVFK